MWIVPVLMIKNEEKYIYMVVHNLAKAGFPDIFIGDTGSTDDTLSEVARAASAEPWPNIIIVNYGPQDGAGLTDVRRDMCKFSKNRGYEWVFQVDGDELYYSLGAQVVLARRMPAGKKLGFTKFVSVELAEDGSLWVMDDWFSRACVYSSSMGWHGDYPFDVQDAFDEPNTFYYYDVPPELDVPVHGFHLHRLQRSGKDADVMARNGKRLQYAMQNQEHKRVTMIGGLK